MASEFIQAIFNLFDQMYTEIFCLFRHTMDSLKWILFQFHYVFDMRVLQNV